ncbi:MAG TPA: amidohydrolase family protein, partial [Casimicrobiaceae bacterium]
LDHDTSMRYVDCTFMLPAAQARPVRDRRISVDNDLITAIGECKPGNRNPTLVMPALVNAHDHARAVRSSSFGAGGKPLETWLHYMAMLPAVDPYLATAVSLAHSALGGAGTVMVHYTRVQGLTDLVTETQQVARAARDVGVRVGFAVALRDINPLVYGPSEPIVNALPLAARAEVERRFLKPPLPITDAMASVEAVASGCDRPEFNVQYGPTGVQWCSPGLLAAVAEASARTGRRVHMHLLETRYQRDWADKNYPQGIVSYLDTIGLLSPRLTLAHCTWARAGSLRSSRNAARRSPSTRARTSASARASHRLPKCSAKAAASHWDSTDLRSTKTTTRCASFAWGTCCTAAPASTSTWMPARCWRRGVRMPMIATGCDACTFDSRRVQRVLVARGVGRTTLQSSAIRRGECP